MKGSGEPVNVGVFQKPLNHHLQGEDAVKMFKEYGGTPIPEGSLNGDQLRKYVMEARERYGLMDNPNISDEEIVKLLKTNDNLQDNNKKEFIRELCEEYCSEKAIFRKGLNKKYNDIEQCAKFLKEKAMAHFNNSEEVANYVVEVCYLENNGKYKSFAWNVFGSYLVDNLLKNSKDKCRITIPMRDDNGDIKYLFNNYSLREVNLDATYI